MNRYLLRASGFMLFVMTSSNAFSEQDFIFKYCKKGDIQIVQDYVESHPEALSQRTLDGKTGLMIAAWNGHLDITAYLVGAGANVTAVDEHGNDALFLASSRKDNAEVLKYLIQHGASVHTRNQSKQTPLHNALQCLVLENALALMEAGADEYAPDMMGTAPIGYAHKYNSALASELINFRTQQRLSTSDK